MSKGAVVTSLVEGGYSQGAAYVPPGSPVFSNPTVLISERTTRAVTAMDVDANGDLVPPLSSRRVFVQGLLSARALASDPLTGDLVMTTYQEWDSLKRVAGFAAPPTFHAVRADEVYASGDAQYVELSDPERRIYLGN